MDAPAFTAGAQLGLDCQLLGARRHKGLQLPFGQQLLDQRWIQQVLQAVLQVHSRRVCNMHMQYRVQPRSAAPTEIISVGSSSNIKIWLCEQSRPIPFLSKCARKSPIGKIGTSSMMLISSSEYSMFQEVARVEERILYHRARRQSQRF